MSAIEEAKRFVRTHSADIHEAGDVFQTAHMLLEQCLQEIERLTAQLRESSGEEK